MTWLKCCTTLLFLLLPLAIKADQNTLLLIESYHAEYPWVQSYRQGLTSTLGTQYKITHFEMDTKRLPREHHAARADLAWNTYIQSQPALVFLADDNALRLLGPKLSRTNTPVVYFGINNSPRNYNLFGLHNITGVLERPTIKNNVHVIKSIINTDHALKILVLLDSGATAQVVQAEVFGGQQQLNIVSTTITLKLIKEWHEWKNAVTNAKRDGYDAMVIGLYHTIIDAAGNHKNSEEILHWSSAHASVPPFGFWDFAVGENKTIGGIVLHGHTQGEAAAEIALNILNGTAPSNIPPTTPERGRFLFSRSQLKKWGIDQQAPIFHRADFVE